MDPAASAKNPYRVADLMKPSRRKRWIKMMLDVPIEPAEEMPPDPRGAEILARLHLKADAFIPFPDSPCRMMKRRDFVSHAAGHLKRRSNEVPRDHGHEISR